MFLLTYIAVACVQPIRDASKYSTGCGAAFSPPMLMGTSVIMTWPVSVVVFVELFLPTPEME
jgi:hypothetical protein